MTVQLDRKHRGWGGEMQQKGPYWNQTGHAAPYAKHVEFLVYKGGSSVITLLFGGATSTHFPLCCSDMDWFCPFSMEAFFCSYSILIISVSVAPAQSQQYQWCASPRLALCE